MLHLTWPFLYPLSITFLCVSAPVMSYYGKLCTESISINSTEIHRILTPIYHRKSTSSVCSLKSRDIAKLLLLCDFLPGIIIYCLGGIYTSNLLDFVLIDAYLLSLSDIPVNPG